jgi:carbon-monoxide dehydrogenase medium subunit
VKPAPFSYETPATLAGALASLALRGHEAKVIAGGQSLAPMLNMRLARPGHLIDINHIVELAEVRLEAESLVVGALVRHADLARHTLVRTHGPMLAHAAGTIGHYAIRQRGTLGGSLAHADPAAQLPLVAAVLEAGIELASAKHRRIVTASDFFQSIFTTAAEPDELVVAVHVPLAAAKGWGFRLFARRAGDFAIVAVAATVQMSPQGGIEQLRIAAAGIAQTPVRLDALAPVGEADAHHPGWPAEIANAVSAAAVIEENDRIPTAYRRELLALLLTEALTEARERAT